MLVGDTAVSFFPTLTSFAHEIGNIPFSASSPSPIGPERGAAWKEHYSAPFSLDALYRGPAAPPPLSGVWGSWSRFSLSPRSLLRGNVPAAVFGPFHRELGLVIRLQAFGLAGAPRPVLQLECCDAS